MRTLKGVLQSSGKLKTKSKDYILKEGETLLLIEQRIVLQSIEENLIPKLVLDDVDKMKQLIKIVFQGVNVI